MRSNPKVSRRMFALPVLLALAAAPALAQATREARIPAGNSQPSAEGSPEGIKVHGHWVIEVRNPDGTLAERREFENALGDRSLIPRLLARKTQNLGLGVAVASGSLPATTCGLMVEADIAGGPPGISKTLTLAAPNGAQEAGRLIFFGSITALNTCSVSTVATVIFTPSVSLTNPFEILTQASVPQGPINVLQGQVFTVSVTLTFS